MYVTDLTAKRGPLWFLPIAPEIENPEENPALLLPGIQFNCFAVLKTELLLLLLILFIHIFSPIILFLFRY